MNKEKIRIEITLFLLAIIVPLCLGGILLIKIVGLFTSVVDSREFNIITTYENKDFEDDLVKYGKKIK